MVGPHNSDAKVNCNPVACGQATGCISIIRERGGFYLINARKLLFQWFHNGIGMKDRVIQCPSIGKLTIAKPL
jgi:hypothetical protein